MSFLTAQEPICTVLCEIHNNETNYFIILLCRCPLVAAAITAAMYLLRPQRRVPRVALIRGSDQNNL